MGKGTMDFRRFPVKKKIYGDEEFYIVPIEYGFYPKTIPAFKICPAKMNGRGEFAIEGEWYSGDMTKHKKEFKDIDVKFIYEPSEFSSKNDIEKVSSFCDMTVHDLLNSANAS